RRAGRAREPGSPSSVAAQSRDDHDLAVGAPVGQQADRLDALLERQPMRDARLQLAVLVPAQELVDRSAELVRRVPAEVAQRGAERGPALAPQAAIALPISTAVRPTPPAAPRTRSVSPASRRPCQRIATWLEMYATGNAPASSKLMAAGIGNVSACGATAISASPP